MASLINPCNAPAASFTLFNFERAVVRTIQRDGEPWFVAADVCAVLGLGNITMALKRLDADEQTLISIEGMTSGPGNPHVNVINESGLYSLTLTSRKPVAKRFKRWVTGEVLPTIRKTGSYSIQAPAIPQSLSAALRLAADQAELIEAQQVLLSIVAPKAAFVDQYVESTGLKGFRQVAKLLKANEARLREFLTDKKIMYRLGGEWSAYQLHIDAGRFDVKTGANQVNQHNFTTTLFTAKGIEWLAGLWAVHCLNGGAV